MGIQALISVFLARKLIILWSVLTMGAVAASVGLVLPKKYESTALVQVDAIQRNTLTGLVEPRVRVAEFLGQQAAVAGSRTVALEVIETLLFQGFLTFSDFETQWREKTGGELVAGNDARLWAADQLLRNLSIEADALESTLAITYRSDNPSQSARIANAFSDSYMQAVLDKRKSRALRNANEFSNERLMLEQELETAQSELTDFRETAGIVALGAQKLEAAEVELASLTARLAEATADKAEAESLLRQVMSAGSNSLLTVPLPGEILYARQAQARLGAVIAQMSRIAERYGEQYPDYLEAKKEKAALEGNILNAIQNRFEYHSRRSNALEQAVADQKSEVVQLQETKQAYDVLEKNVAASRDTYDLVASRSLEESLQSRVDSVTTYLLARAVPSADPATPPYALVVVIGLFAGAALGASAAVALEFYEGRLRSEAAVKQVLRAPVLARVPVHATSTRKKRRKRANGRRAA